MSHLIIGQEATLYNIGKAEDIAESLADDDWHYVLHFDGEWAKIEVLDENNDHLGWL